MQVAPRSVEREPSQSWSVLQFEGSTELTPLRVCHHAHEDLLSRIRRFKHIIALQTRGGPCRRLDPLPYD